MLFFIVFTLIDAQHSFIIVLQACDRLLTQRVDIKVKGQKVKDVLNRLRVAEPTSRDQKVRICHLVFINICSAC